MGLGGGGQKAGMGTCNSINNKNNINQMKHSLSSSHLPIGLLT